jgi:hypothetical protein
MNNVFQREKKTTHLNLAISRAGPPIPHPTSNTFTNQKVYVKITPIINLIAKNHASSRFAGLRIFPQH